MDRKYVIFTSKAVAIKLYTLVIILCLLYSIPVLALNEVTASAINGTSPYITINQDRSPSDIIDLLWIAVKKDDNQTQIAPSTNEQGPVEDPNLIYYRPDFNSSPDELIDLPSSIDTFDKIITLVSDYKKEQEELETILTDKQYFEDNDGDDGFKATGTFKIEIKDSDNKAVKLSDKLDDCVGFYAVTLTTSDSELSTTYGLPNNKNYPSASKTYYVRSLSGGLPHVCWLQPSLEKGSPPYAFTQQQYDNYFDEFPNYSDNIAVWSPTKGFKPSRQYLKYPYGNFPTTAADKLYFNIVLSGAKWQDISYTKSPKKSPLELKLSGKNNILRVEFSGPKLSEKFDEEITYYTDETEFSFKVGDRNIYSFSIDHWFYISTETVKAQKFAEQYCKCKGSESLFAAEKEEITNALSYTTMDDNEENHYIRDTETFLGEWGNTINEVYPSDDLGNVMSNTFWTGEYVYEDDYNNLIRKNNKVKPKNHKVKPNLYNIDDDDDDGDDDGDDEWEECLEEPEDPYYTYMYAIDFNDGSIKKLPNKTEGLRVICMAD